ncbi:MAG TPA: sigma-70 family RNA polymerase sigma factor [Nocardioides sp.]|nr:sigma-70 family RNA polymerase sigma factor [Nocardioides sp.]
MVEQDWLAERFEESRPRLRAVAYRMLGSADEADDAVQEAWLRLSSTDAEEVRSLPAWLTTVVARISLNMLRKRGTRGEQPLDGDDPAPPLRVVRDDPEEAALLADSVGMALLVVLETLTPAERLAFVLHDMFDVPFDEIATIVDKSPAATRQLASRARRRVRGLEPPEPDLSRQRRVVEAYLAATRDGDFEGLVRLLDPDVVLRVDAEAMPTGRGLVLRGRQAVAGGAVASAARARASELAVDDGSVGMVMATGSRPTVALRFLIVDDAIAGIDVIAAPDRLARLELADL